MMKRRKSRPRSKTYEISAAVDNSTVAEVERLGRSEGGFLTREWRRVFWRRVLIAQPIIDHSEDWRIEKLDSGHFDQDIMKQIAVIDADVLRCVSQWDIHESIDSERRSQIREDLRSILVSLVYKHRATGFKYYQGLHEVGLVFLHVANPTQAFYMMEALTLKRLANFVYLPFNISLLPLADAVMYLISLADPELHAKFSKTGTPSHFCIPWLLTWFAHCFSTSLLTQRVFDFLLTSHPALVVHLCTALVLQGRIDLLALPDEMSALHSAAQSLPRGIGLEELEEIINRAVRLEKSVCSVHALARRFPVCMQQPELLTKQGKSQVFTRAAATVAVAVALGAAVAVSTPTALLSGLFRET